MPMEYLGKHLRNELIDRATGLDVWLCKNETMQLEDEAKLRAQEVLRRFVVLAKADGSSIVS